MIDLYRLLELQPLESDMAKVRAALKRQVELAQSSEDERVRRQASQIIELGSNHLLNAERKAIYDRKWTAEIGSPAPKPAMKPSKPSSRDSDRFLGPLAAALPAGDPDKPFDLAGFLENSASIPVTQPTAAFEKLLSMLQDGGKHSETHRGKSAPSDSGMELGQTAQSRSTAILSEDRSRGLRGARKQGVPRSGESSAFPRGMQVASKRKLPAKAVRQKRDRSLLMAVGGLLVTLAIVLAVMLFMVNQSRSSRSNSRFDLAALEVSALEVSEAERLAAADTAVNSPSVGGANPRSGVAGIPRGSGLPKIEIPEEFGSAAEGDLESSEIENANSNFESTEMRDNPDAIPKEEAARDPVSRVANAAAMQSTDAVEAGLNSTPMASSDARPPEALLSEPEREAWQTLVGEIRSELGQRDYAAVEECLAQLQESARTQRQKDQWIRLQTIANLAKECSQALSGALSGLSAGETFQVRSTTVALVEATDQQLVIRVQGQNMRYAIEEIPAGIVEALVGMRMDSSQLASKVRIACFLLWHPGTNEVSMPKIMRWLQEAEDAGLIPEATIEVAADEYSL